MKKRTVLLTTIMVTLGTTFLHCGTVEAGSGMFHNVVEPYGFYTIAPECVYNDYTDNDYIDSVYLIEISQVGDDVELSIVDSITNQCETYDLTKMDSFWYHSLDADDVFIKYSEEYSGWFLNLDGTRTCLDPITWQYSYTPTISDDDWTNPIGLYYDEDYNCILEILDLYDTGYYVASYSDEYNNHSASVNVTYQEDGSMIYDIYGFGTIYADRNGYSLVYGANEIELIKSVPYTYEHLDTYDYLVFDTDYYENGEYYTTVHIEFDYYNDRGEQLFYRMSSDLWNEEITGYAILTANGLIVSNDFIITSNGEEYQIGIPKITPYWVNCNWDIIG